MRKYFNKMLPFTFGLCLVALHGKAQYIECSYDAAGNRIKREYIPPPPPLVSQKPTIVEPGFLLDITDSVKATAIATTGNISIQLKEPLTNAGVNIIDAGGRTIIRNVANGTRLEYNLSMYPAGVYFLTIRQKGKPYVVKVLKQ